MALFYQLRFIKAPNFKKAYFPIVSCKSNSSSLGYTLVTLFLKVYLFRQSSNQAINRLTVCFCYYGVGGSGAMSSWLYGLDNQKNIGLKFGTLFGVLEHFFGSLIGEEKFQKIQLMQKCNQA